jgi:hypothetical protein
MIRKFTFLSKYLNGLKDILINAHFIQLVFTITTVLDFERNSLT